MLGDGGRDGDCVERRKAQGEEACGVGGWVGVGRAMKGRERESFRPTGCHGGRCTPLVSVFAQRKRWKKDLVDKAWRHAYGSHPPTRPTHPVGHPMRASPVDCFFPLPPSSSSSLLPPVLTHTHPFPPSQPHSTTARQPRSPPLFFASQGTSPIHQSPCHTHKGDSSTQTQAHRQK